MTHSKHFIIFFAVILYTSCTTQKLISQKSEIQHNNIVWAVKLPNSIEPIEPFHEGRAVVKYDSKFGFININGNFVINAIYDEAKSFYNGLAIVKLDEKYGIIDRFGNIKYPFVFDKIESPYYDDNLFLQIGEEFFYINSYGGIVDFTTLHEAYKKSHTGYLATRQSNDKYQYVYVSGSIALKNQFDYARDFSEGFGQVEINEKKGFVDRSGKYIVKPIYLSASDYSEGYAFVLDSEHTNFLLDVNGKVVFDESGGYSVISSIHDGTVILRENSTGIKGYAFNPLFTEIQLADWKKYYDECLNEIEEDFPPASVLYDKVVSSSKNNDSVNELEDMNNLLSHYPYYHEMHYNRGLYYYRMKNYLAARLDCAIALAIEPNNASYYSLRGMINTEDGHLLLAINDFSNTIQLDINGSSAYEWRGYLYDETGDYRSAENDYNTVLKLDPTNQYAKKRLIGLAEKIKANNELIERNKEQKKAQEAKRVKDEQQKKEQEETRRKQQEELSLKMDKALMDFVNDLNQINQTLNSQAQNNLQNTTNGQANTTTGVNISDNGNTSSGQVVVITCDSCNGTGYEKTKSYVSDFGNDVYMDNPCEICGSYKNHYHKKCITCGGTRKIKRFTK